MSINVTYNNCYRYLHIPKKIIISEKIVINSRLKIRGKNEIITIKKEFYGSFIPVKLSNKRVRGYNRYEINKIDPDDVRAIFGYDRNGAMCISPIILKDLKRYRYEYNYYRVLPTPIISIMLNKEPGEMIEVNTGKYMVFKELKKGNDGVYYTPYRRYPIPKITAGKWYEFTETKQNIETTIAVEPYYIFSEGKSSRTLRFGEIGLSTHVLLANGRINDMIIESEGRNKKLFPVIIEKRHIQIADNRSMTVDGFRFATRGDIYDARGISWELKEKLDEYIKTNYMGEK